MCIYIYIYIHMYIYTAFSKMAATRNSSPADDFGSTWGAAGCVYVRTLYGLKE